MCQGPSWPDGKRAQEEEVSCMAGVAVTVPFGMELTWMDGRPRRVRAPCTFQPLSMSPTGHLDNSREQHTLWCMESDGWRLCTLLVF